MTPRPPKRATVDPRPVAQPAVAPPPGVAAGTKASPPSVYPAPGGTAGASSSSLPCITTSREAKIPAAGTRAPGDGIGASPVPSPGLQAAAAKMTENSGPDSLDAHVRRYLKDLGLMGYHTRTSIGSPKGYPDWTIAGPGGHLFRELKTQRGTVTPEQQAWLDVLAAGGADAGVWRPEDLFSGRIANELVAVAGLGMAAS